MFVRRKFAELLYEEMKINDKIFVLVGDLGYGMFDKIKQDFPNRFKNVGAAEYLMVGMGIGLSFSGFIPILYSISPFLIYRPFELLKLYVNFENIPVKLIGSGRDYDYHIDGESHNATGI